MTTPNTTTGAMGDIVQDCFDQSALYNYREKNIHRALASIHHSREDGPMPSDVVQWTRINKLATATSAISETADPSPVALGDTQFSATLVEYGNTIQPTKKLRLTGFLNIDMAAVHEITGNMEESVDLIAQATLITGTNVKRPGDTAQASLAATDVMTAALLRLPAAKLKGFVTPPIGMMAAGAGEVYAGIIHPDVLYDVQLETGQAAWNAPHVFGGSEEAVLRSVAGVFGGTAWVENANAYINADAGAGNVDVYYTLIAGEQALGEAVGEAQHVIISEATDNLRRFPTFNWYALLGYCIGRQNSLYRLETASSIGANV